MNNRDMSESMVKKGGCGCRPKEEKPNVKPCCQPKKNTDHVNLQKIVDVLNDLHKKDPEAIDMFMRSGVSVNDAILDSDNVYVHCEDADYNNPTLRPLGLINGIIDDTGMVITANYTDERVLTGFSLNYRKELFKVSS